MTSSDQRHLFRSFTVHGTGQRGDDGAVSAWGIQMPSGWVAVEWRLDAYSDSDRMEDPHRSTYGTIRDFLLQIEDAHVHFSDGEVRHASEVGGNQ